MYVSTLSILLNEAVDMLRGDDEYNNINLLNDIIKDIGRRTQVKNLNKWSNKLLNTLNSISIHDAVQLLKSAFIINTTLELHWLPRLSNTLRTYLHVRAVTVLSEVRREMELEFRLLTICDDDTSENKSLPSTETMEEQ